MLFQPKKTVFYAIHVKKITKFVVWDIFSGSAIYFGISTVHSSELVAYGASAVTIESVNQFLKRTKIGRRLIK